MKNNITIAIADAIANHTQHDVSVLNVNSKDKSRLSVKNASHVIEAILLAVHCGDKKFIEAIQRASVTDLTDGVTICKSVAGSTLIY
jgi:hypothetical protein